MLRSASALALLLCLTAVAATAQEQTPVLTVRSTLVQVPVQVKTKSGENVFALTADDFIVTDNGVPQRVTIDPDTDFQPLALAIVVETGGDGAHHLADYYHLDPILDALIGSIDHRVAVIGFDSTPHLLVPFTPDTAVAAHQLANLQAGDQGAAVLDAVAFAVAQLRTQPASYRRAILLLSETLDQGSTTTLTDALRLISDTNTTMYSFAFSSTRSQVSHEASKFNRPDVPGPAHGCFSRDGADAEYKEHYSRQVLDCISDLAPPIRLATMAFLAARNALRTNTAESIAQLTGGEFAHFHDARDLQRRLIPVSNDVPNYYVLSFRPTDTSPGLHALHVELKDRPHLEVRARSEYWIEDDTAR
ncbi:VWA domain-containing protein [Alloacidobacterium sp.]|uniref:VWA domain-containing protein n=1 Tax=Alloacidobacterium sp. TaxID=2951999 RepID=UPI002D4A10AA|nr:VWA domain-containing protein [Alloacidobacterium sp.]HYK36933.1 VWA domain-containing protein [Alloacidobacterium sp.]